MALEKFTFLDEVGIQKLAEALLTKVNARVAERIVQEVSDASDGNHVASAVLLNSLLKTRDTLIASNAASAVTNKTAIDGAVADINTLKTKAETNTTNAAAAAASIIALDEKVGAFTHLTTDIVTGSINDVVDPKTDVLYFQRDDEADTTWMLYIYREDGTWVQIGDTGVDLTGYWSKDDNAQIKETIGVPEMTALPNDSILAAIDAAFTSTDVFTPPTKYFDITADGSVSASNELRKYRPGTPVDLVIPSNIDGIAVIRIADDGFRDCVGIGSITIPEGIVTIGNRAFAGDVNLHTAYIPKSVKNLGEEAYINCAITHITIPMGVENIANGTFYGCTSLTSVNIPNTAISIGESAFGRCISLAFIFIPQSVTIIADTAFAGSGISEINVNNVEGSISGNWNSTNATVNWKGFLVNTHFIYPNPDGSSAFYMNLYGTISGTGYYNPGDTVTMTATGKGSNSMDGWTCTIGGIDIPDPMVNPIVFTMPSHNVVITTNFSQKIDYI